MNALTACRCGVRAGVVVGFVATGDSRRLGDSLDRRPRLHREDYNQDEAADTAIVWQAEGVLMARYGVSAQEALQMLIQQVTSGEGDIREVCRKIVAGAGRDR